MVSFALLKFMKSSVSFVFSSFRHNRAWPLWLKVFSTHALGYGTPVSAAWSRTTIGASFICWLALPFALQVDRRGRMAPAAAAALAALTAFFLLANAGNTLTRLAFLPVGVAPWTTPLLFMVLAGIALARRRA